jgi:methyl-accepting chemotaxis protein
MWCAALLGAALLLPATGRAQNVDPPAAAPANPELSAQDREVLAVANQLATDAAQIMERWLAAKEITEDRLRSRLYFPVAGTDPIKFTTEYDKLADRDLVAVQEKALARSTAFSYAVVSDLNGYVPTHNQKYSQPLTGNRAVDLVNNRGKRIYGDRTGLLAARSTAPYLIQHYERDTGEPLTDLSVPVVVRGKRWGTVRIGYQRETR